MFLISLASGEKGCLCFGFHGFWPMWRYVFVSSLQGNRGKYSFSIASGELGEHSFEFMALDGTGEYMSSVTQLRANRGI